MKQNSIRPRPGFDWSLVNWGAPNQPRTDRCSYCDDPFPDEFESDFIPLILGNKDGWVAEFCDHCQAAWFGVELFPEPPDDFDPDVDPVDLGSCCGGCGQPAGKNVVQLSVRNLVPGHGWGCFVCDLPPDGATAVLCNDCTQRMEAGEDVIRFACRGYPASDGRVPIGELTEPFDHDLERHMAEERGGADAG